MLQCISCDVNPPEPLVSSLPVAAVLPELLAALNQAPQVLLIAPTGAGKSTWLPLQLLSRYPDGGKILLLEPRRLAARNVAQRMAELCGEPVGETVGYRMRSEHCVSSATRLEVITEGILTRRIQQDPELNGVSMVILDEFHERSLQADLALALLLDLQSGLREDLKIVIMSATLDDTRLQQRLPEAPVISSSGRTFPVARRYTPLAAHQRFEEAVAGAVAGLLRDEPGSLLLFLPGVSEIKRVQHQLSERVAEDVLLCPLYGVLPLKEQRQAILPAPAGKRKVVLATNIAETSLTIEGVRLVVDCGLERAVRFDPLSGLSRLVTQRISQASMTQRAGRAGRMEPGICLHLLSAEQAERASLQSTPEILTSDLSGLLMDILQWGCQDVSTLTWLDTPPKASLAQAQSVLRQLGATDEKLRLTQKGQKMASIGSDPRLSALLVSATTADEYATAALLAALLEDPPRAAGTADLRALLDSPSSSVRQRASQLLRRAARPGGKLDPDALMPLLAQAFPDRIARRRGSGGRYQLANGAGAMLDDDNPLTRYEWLIAPLLQQSASSPDARILLALPIDISQLQAQCPALIETDNVVEWHEGHGALKALRRRKIGKLVITVQQREKPSEEEMQQAILTGIREKGPGCLNWTPQAEQLRLRLSCAARWLPEYSWPAVDDESLLASLEQWLLPEMRGVQSLNGLKKIDLTRALGHLLDWSVRQRLDSVLPTHYTVPTGSQIAIRYSEDNPPVLAVRMQEMFGESTTPCIAEGRIPLVLELLSPAQRPLQITRDLTAFWKGAYPEVQKEMKGRYPKHVWPDSPAEAVPTQRTKKYQ